LVFGIEQRRLLEQSLKARVTARWRVERRNECLPFLAIEREDAPISEPLFSFAKRGVEYEFANRFVFRGCRGLQGLFGVSAQPNTKPFRSIGASGHFTR
jgi:hypothetical protein